MANLQQLLSDAEQVNEYPVEWQLYYLCAIIVELIAYLAEQEEAGRLQKRAIK